MSRRLLTAGLLAACAPFAAADGPEKHVVIESRVVKLDAAAAKQLNLDGSKTKPIFLDPVSHFQYLVQLQSMRGLQFTAAPTVVAVSGQTAHVQTLQPYTFTELLTVGGDGVAVPKQRTVELGYKMEFLPSVSADDRTIRLKYEMCETALRPKVPQMSVTTMIEPVFADGNRGVPVPFTKFVDKPTFDTATVQETVTLPMGNTVMTAVGSRPCEKKLRHKVPFLGDVFPIADLFTWETSEPDVEHTFMILTANPAPQAAPAVPSAVTPRSVPSPRPLFATPAPVMPAATLPPMTAPQAFALQYTVPLPPLCPATSSEPPATAPAKNAAILTILLEQYDVACKAGDSAKAKTIAAYCLEMDPACFAKK